MVGTFGQQKVLSWYFREKFGNSSVSRYRITDFLKSENHRNTVVRFRLCGV
jgi:hypothetical protein